ncbi:glutathione S-transferase N-terminal domain-containing protein [Alphaproteobacteria bacterium]|jgi:glutaredoxin|nr:glutathione S-transferase N-terminal domain-containing protein [Alphaproteobacteria bacterium]|tara:strand:+ start:1378 stop:1743 length:366 start_codon:yes stop_codon:yes gene_type:complete
MKVIRWILGRMIIFLDFVFSPQSRLRDKNAQDLINTITNSYKLYQYYACPFCVKVRRFLKRESINITLIDAKKVVFKKHLIQNGGMLKVPCLRVQSKKNQVKWIYESNEIIDFISKETKGL